MTKTYTCQTCTEPVEAGEAVMRTRSFEPTPLAWHRACYDATHAEPSIPAQRTGDELAARA